MKFDGDNQLNYENLILYAFKNDKQNFAKNETVFPPSHNEYWISVIGRAIDYDASSIVILSFTKSYWEKFSAVETQSFNVACPFRTRNEIATCFSLLKQRECRALPFVSFSE
jgi:hypothetical protein